MSAAPNRLPRGCTHLLGRPSGTIAVTDDHEAGIVIAARYGHAVAVAPHGGLLAAARAVRARYPCLSVLVARRWDQAQTEAREAADSVGGTVIEWRQA